MADSRALLEQLQAHLIQVQNDPATRLDSKLLETCELFLVPQVSPESSQQLVGHLAQLLPTLQQDPTLVNKLLLKLLEPYPFSSVLQFDPPVDFAAGLDLVALPFNQLTLSLLDKAAVEASSARRLATSQPAVFVALVRLWLCTEDSGVADKAGSVLYGLLKVDMVKTVAEQRSDDASADRVGLEGAVWKRVFRDKDVYGSIFSICSLDSQKHDITLSKNRKTVAQARLMEWLPKVGALNWASISEKHPIAEGKPSDQSLLEFAAVHMVDHKSDVLMHRSLISFYADLIRCCTQAQRSSESSVSLDYLRSQKLHARTLALYIKPDDPSHDPVDIIFLYSAAADYLSVYMDTYPDDFVSDSGVRDRVLARLSSALDFSPSRWAQGESPKHDLHVLASLPRSVLTPSGSALSAWRNSPLSLVPSRPSNADALNTLATIFHGPAKSPNVITYPAESPMADTSNPRIKAEGSAARSLYFMYLSHNDRLWTDVVTCAETPALKENALAAINLISAVITANWPTSSASSSNGATDTGVEAMLMPAALSSVVPYLLRPPQTFSNLVGGRGDAESAAYRLAMAKFDALRAFHDRLSALLEGRPVEEAREKRQILDAIRSRFAEGPWGRASEVGGRIGTLEL